MMRGSRYNEWVDIYQLELQVGRKSKGKMYWTVTGIREVDEVFVQNCYGMNGIYLAPKPNGNRRCIFFLRSRRISVKRPKQFPHKFSPNTSPRVISSQREKGGLLHESFVESDCRPPRRRARRMVGRARVHRVHSRTRYSSQFKLCDCLMRRLASKRKTRRAIC